MVFRNVLVFNGTENQLLNVDVLVRGNLIEAVGTDPATHEDVTVIDGQGKTLMPGLIDSHVHFNLSMSGGRLAMESSRWDFIAVMGAAAAQDWLADGFTTARDMGGMHDGLRRVIDAGLIDSPRLYLSTGMISQTSGHADMLLVCAVSSSQPTEQSCLADRIALADEALRIGNRRRRIL